MQIIGFSIAVIFFALMRQAHAWDLDWPVPSMLTAVESNMRMPLPFFLLAIVPIFVSLFLSFLMSQPFPPFASFITVSAICYLFANGSIIILILVTQLVFYVTAFIHIFIKTRLVGSIDQPCYIMQQDMKWCVFHFNKQIYSL
jgi:glycosylphosphatidylinositol deacylase